MKIFKSSILMFLMIVIISSFLCCGNIVTKKRYEITGKRLIQNYIKDKYGFDGEIVDVYLGQENGSILDFFPDYDGRVSIKMKYNSKEFYVSTNAQTRDSQCYDNYQMSEIQQAVKDKITTYTGIEPFGFHFYYGNIISLNSYDNGLVTKYFDGNNLDDIFNDSTIQIMSIFEFTENVDLNKFNDLKLSSIGTEKLLFINYKNAAAINKVTTHTYSMFSDSPDSHLYENSVYIKNAKLIDNGTVTDFTMNGKEYNGIYYICPTNNNSLSISPHKSIDVSNWYGSGVGKDKCKSVTPTYNIHSDTISDSSQNDIIYVFYPAQNLNMNGYYKIGLNYNTSKTESFDMTAAFFVGDYISFKVPQNKIDQNFTVILDYA